MLTEESAHQKIARHNIQLQQRYYGVLLVFDFICSPKVMYEAIILPLFRWLKYDVTTQLLAVLLHVEGLDFLFVGSSYWVIVLWITDKT
ncbi:MAG: hypothetical protein ACJA2G_002737 [Cognaticolwellia sp.]|jgi:hypothetical protein